MIVNGARELKQDPWASNLGNLYNRRLKVMLPGREQPIFLTKREAMIVALMMLGDRAKQIAWKLEISLHTVNSHMANIKHKLDCSTNFEVGYRLGWYKFYQEQKQPAAMG